MQERRQHYTFKGMRRDIDKSIVSSEYLYDAMNIRLTAREDNTLLTITNEKGNEKVFNLEGYLLGYVTIDDRAVFFIKNNDIDFIYLVDFNDVVTYTVLYKGNLNFKLENPIESLALFENEELQKVYWVDGINQPRVINISTPKAIRDKWIDTSFDFVQSIDNYTSTLPIVSINKVQDGNGVFPAGIVQYAFSFYNKYGSESNIFYVSDLQYTSTNNRGISPDKNSSCAFNIKIENIAYSQFDYIRVYSILRSSYNATPTAKVVTSLSIKDLNSVTFTDSNLTGYNIEPTNLLYVGGYNIIANTITQKDNTLFLGGINQIEHNPTVNTKTNLKTQFSNKFVWTKKELAICELDGYYPYESNIGKSSSHLRTFKGGEYYRLGLQFQRHNGTWTEAVFLGDVKCDKYCFSDGNKYYGSGGIFRGRIDNVEGFLAVRPIIVYPDISNRSILAQGVLNSTVFNVGDRMTNSPFTQASWFFRPYIKNPKESSIEFRPFYPLTGNNSVNCEIQNIPPISTEDIVSLDGSQYNRRTIQDANKFPNWDSINKQMFFIDNNIVTLNSPDIEFDDNVLNANFKNYKLRIIGAIPITGNSGNISIQADNGAWLTSTNFSVYSGFYSEHFGTPSYDIFNCESLLGKPFWMDCSYEDRKKEVKKDTKYKRGFIVYPWHRNGTLNDTISVEKDELKRGILKYKKLINYKYSAFNNNLKKPINIEVQDTNVFHSNEITIEKLKIPNSFKSECIYYGNIDKVLPSYSKFPIVSSTAAYNSVTFEIPSTAPSDSQIKFIKNFVSTFTLYHTDSQGIKSQVVTFNFEDYPFFNEVDLPVFTKGFGTQGYSVEIVPRVNIPFQLILYSKSFPSDTTTFNVSPVEGMDSYFDSSISQNKMLYNNNNRYYPESRDKWSNDMVSMKYKSTPHAIISLGGSDNTLNILPYLSNNDSWEYLNDCYFKWANNKDTKYTLESIKLSESDFINKTNCNSYLWLAELYRDIENPFGPITDADIANSQWVIGGKTSLISSNGDFVIEWDEGDSFYQRYDCIKTYPFTKEDQNSIIELLSFMVETRINLDARYDRNRGNYNSLAISPLNYNLINPVYNQSNNFFKYRSYDSSQIRLTNFPMQILWSKTKILGEEIDTWTNITLANSIDLDGDKGNLNALRNFNNTIYAFQDKGISTILYNENAQIATTTGVPIEIANSGKVQGKRYISSVIGCNNKWSICESPMGLYFIDSNTGGLYIINPQISTISDQKGFKQWFSKQHTNKVWNPKDQLNFRTYYDYIHNDVYLIKDDVCLVFSEYLGEFTSFMSYEKTQGMFNMKDNFYAFNSHSLWRNFKGRYNSFFGKKQPFSLTFICNGQTPLEDKIFNSIEYKADFFNEFNDYEALLSFDRLEAWNEYQKGIQEFSYRSAGTSNLKKKFNVWRGLLPRDSRRQRLRNPWLTIKLEKYNPKDYKMILRSLETSYYV